MVSKMVEHFNVVDHPILNNPLFLKQFPAFSTEYANKFAGYREISNDNKAFMDDYGDHSLYKKIPQSYQKLMQNYGTVDFRDLDPKSKNLFSTIPSTRATTRKSMTRVGSQGQIKTNQMFSPKGSMGQSLYSQFPGPNPRQLPLLTSPKNQFIREDLVIQDSLDSKPRTAQDQISRKGPTEKIIIPQDQLLSPKSQATMPIVNIEVDENNMDGRQTAPLYNPNDPEYPLYSKIQQLQRIISHAYKNLRTYQLNQNKVSSPKSFLSISMEEIERMRHFEETQIKLLEAAVQLQLREQLIHERHEQEMDKQHTNELHHKLLSRKLIQKSDSQKVPFYKQQTLVGIPYSGESTVMNLGNRMSTTSLNFNFTQGMKNVQNQKSIFAQNKKVGGQQQQIGIDNSESKYKNIYPLYIYSKEELLFHELQKMITKLTSIKSYDLSFQVKFQYIDMLKQKTMLLKKMIDGKEEDEEKSIIKLSHTKFIDDMIAQLEKHYQTQMINQSKKRMQRESLKTQLLELETRENQLRNTNFKYKKFYQKNVDDLHEMKDYLKEIQDRIRNHYDYLNHQNAGQYADQDPNQKRTLNRGKFSQMSTFTVGNLRIIGKHKNDNQKKIVRFIGSSGSIDEEQLLSQKQSKMSLQYVNLNQGHNMSRESDDLKINIQLRDNQLREDSRSISLRSQIISPKLPYKPQNSKSKRTGQDEPSHANTEDFENVQSVSGPTENQSNRHIDEEDEQHFQSDSNHEDSEIIQPLIDQDAKILMRYKDFDNISEMISEFFNPLQQNKQIIQNTYNNSLLKPKSFKTKSTQKLQPLNQQEVNMINDLTKLEMREICKAEELQSLIQKATSQNREENKNVAHQYTMLKRTLQKKLKYQDLEKLKNLTQQILLDQNDISLTTSSKRSMDFNNKLGSGMKASKSQKLLGGNAKGNKTTENFTNMLFHNMYGVQQLRIHANEFGIIEKLEDYSSKNGVYDDGLKEHIQKLKNYKSNLEIIDRKLVHIAANHLNL
eukprot:403366190